MAQMEFVDAEGAGEVFECPLAVGGHIDLTYLPVEAVVEEAVGQIQKEIPLDSVTCLVRSPVWALLPGLPPVGHAQLPPGEGPAQRQVYPLSHRAFQSYVTVGIRSYYAIGLM